MTIGKNNVPRTKPANAPPTPSTQLIPPTMPSEMNPAKGIMKKISIRPMAISERVGVTMISTASGTTLCSFFSTIDNNQTAKITPKIPPCPAARASSVNKFFSGASGFIPVSITTAPITPPSVGVAPKTCAALIPV